MPDDTTPQHPPGAQEVGDGLSEPGESSVDPDDTMTLAPCGGRVATLSDQKVLITGKIYLEGTRVEQRDVEQKIERHGGSIAPERSKSVTLLVYGDLGSQWITDPVNVRSKKAVYADEQRRKGNHICIVDNQGLTDLLQGSSAPCLESRPLEGGSVELGERGRLGVNPSLSSPAPGARIFGAVPGVQPGAGFSSRQELHDADIHRPLQAGISGGAGEGADSIVVSGGYEDDEDYGDELIYTGHGGNDPGTLKQVANQELTRQNMALAVSSDRGLPVRVIRGLGGDPTHSPSSGYRYDGLYYVESYWLDKGKSGFDIWRFRLVRSPSENPVTNPKPGVPPSGNQRREYATTQRLVRNTAVTEWVKQLYAYRCQVCGVVLHTPSGPYAEGAHLRPVGRPHNGPDEASNVLCLCPNDHVRLDRGVIGLTADGEVVELETGNTLGELTIEQSHGLDFAQAAYHRSIHTP